MAGNGTRWPWWAVLGLTHSLAVTPQPYHPVAVRLEVKNTRRTLVLSKVKCVTRQPGGAENNPCLHSADSWLPRPPLPGRSQESICGRGGKGQGKALGHPKPLRGGDPRGPFRLASPVMSPRHAGVTGQQPVCCVAPRQLCRPRTGYRLRLTPSCLCPGFPRLRLSSSPSARSRRSVGARTQQALQMLD